MTLCEHNSLGFDDVVATACVDFGVRLVVDIGQDALVKLLTGVVS